jgi:hypothetical protein
MQQQRQLRLGDILDDYCPRERRLTNHAVVAMVGPDVKQTRCTTCDAEHEYKHAKVPRQRRKTATTPALYAQVLAGGPKRVAHEEHGADNGTPPDVEDVMDQTADAAPPPADEAHADMAALSGAAPENAGDVAEASDGEDDDAGDEREDDAREQGPVHRPLIRASLPRSEGQAPPTRPAPDFTIRQPGGGRPNRFRPRNARGGQFQGTRSNGGMAGPMRGGPPRAGGGGRPPHGPMTSRPGRRDGPGRKRSK